jgi:AraC family transcriptional regulator, regulatory protein of adaptative response / methylated-DNA-[protein]-cysteine methyltransferase
MDDVSTEDGPRWDAVAARDATADTGWVYAVRTTGVYCRPGCPSRRPRRDNVEFHDSAAAAAAAGFRACQRCRPEEAGAPDPAADLVAGACRLIERSDRVPTLAQLGRDLGVSPYHLQRTFRAATGVSPRAYAEQLRTRRVAERLEQGTPVSDAAYEAGYGTAARLAADSGGRLGMVPSRFRSGGAGEHIRVAVADSSLGPVLVAATDRGICAIDLGGDPDELLDRFQQRFHAAEIVAGDAGFDRSVAVAVAVVDGTSTGDRLALDIRGTAFQERVWRALRAIPAGSTTTYAELAAAIGAPSSVRAVAGACAANSLAVAVPCHRVVRTDGGLSGYRWGIDRKRELLEREGALSPAASPR